MKKRIKLTWGIALCTMLFIGCELNDNVSPSGNGNTSFTSANDYLKSKAPKTLQFTKQANQRFTLVSENGLHYRFKPNSFKTASGQIVNGQVDIKLTEYMTITDMVFSGITTTSGSTLLESGAMYNLTASQNGQVLQLVDDYRVQVPSQDQDPSMIIFEGELIEDSTGAMVNWVPSKNSNVVRDSTRSDTTWSDTTYDPGYYYTLKIRFLSWCNLDKYWNAPTGSPVRVKINETDKYPCIVHLALKDMNGLVYLGYDHQTGEYNSRKYNLPNGWDIAIIVVYVDRDKEQLEYAWVDSKTQDNHYVEIDKLTVISEEDLEALVKTLQ